MLELYQTEWCPASRRVREHLTELGVDYLIHQVPVEREARATLVAATGSDTIPTLLVGGETSLVGEEAIVLYLVIGISPTAFPLLPWHLTLIATLAVGIPSFFPALEASSGRVNFDRFLRNVSHFSVPAGIAVGLGVVASYLTALQVVNLPLVEARTVAVTAMLSVSLYLIVVLEASGRRRATAVLILCIALAAVYLVVLLLPFSRSFFALAQPNLAIALIAAGGFLVAVGGLILSSDSFIPMRTEAVDIPEPARA